MYIKRIHKIYIGLAIVISLILLSSCFFSSDIVLSADLQLNYIDSFVYSSSTSKYEKSTKSFFDNLTNTANYENVKSDTNYNQVILFKTNIAIGNININVSQPSNNSGELATLTFAPYEQIDNLLGKKSANISLLTKLTPTIIFLQKKYVNNELSEVIDGQADTETIMNNVTQYGVVSGFQLNTPAKEYFAIIQKIKIGNNKPLSINYSTTKYKF
jgi:hypothetical protein